VVGDLRGLVPAFARAGDELCHIAGGGCPHTLPIAGRPLIRHAIRSLCDAGIDEILIVVDPALAEEIVVAVGDPGVALHYALERDRGEESLLRAARAALGPGPVLVHLSDGPYTSIGARVELEGVEIENSIVLPGAQIRFPGRRIEASLVGEGAQIGRDYTLPSALRLRVGPGSDIQLS
jgi:NDP-sugar pyrophosphorylase family protein